MGPCFNIKTVFSGIGILIITTRQWLYLYNGNPYTDKRARLFWDDPGNGLHFQIFFHIEAETKWPSFRRRRFQIHFFFNENVWILIKISLKFVPRGPINNIHALVQVMAWHRSGDKTLSTVSGLHAAIGRKGHSLPGYPGWMTEIQWQITGSKGPFGPLPWDGKKGAFHFANNKN